MNVPGSLHYRAFLLCVFAAVSAGAQELPAVPPSVDPAFWGHPNKPYILKLTVASTIRDGSKPQQTRTSEEDVVRDSLGRVRTETFYESGRPNSVSIRDPNKNTFTFLKIVNKTAFIISLPKHMGPSPEKGWDVEPLPSRVIAGIPAEGFRFIKTIPASADGQTPEDTIVEEDWISRNDSLLLEQRIDSQRTGVSTRSVLEIKQVEPDAMLFSIPDGYKLQQPPAPVGP